MHAVVDMSQTLLMEASYLRTLFTAISLSSTLITADGRSPLSSDIYGKGDTTTGHNNMQHALIDAEGLEIPSMIL